MIKNNLLMKRDHQLKASYEHYAYESVDDVNKSYAASLKQAKKAFWPQRVNV